MDISYYLRIGLVRSRSKTVASIVSLLMAALVAGCDHVDESRRRVIATNRPWEIIGVGDLDSPGTALGIKRIAFEAINDGRLFGRGPLYEAGANDLAFVDRFSGREWSRPNVLHLWTVPDRDATISPVSISVNNADPSAVKWFTVRIIPTEVFLALNIGPAQTITLPSVWADGALCVLEGMAKDDEVIQRVELNLKAHRSKIDITISKARFVYQP